MSNEYDDDDTGLEFDRWLAQVRAKAVQALTKKED